MSLTINIGSFGSPAFFWGAIGIVTALATTGYAAYCRLLPRPLPGIPYNAEAAKLIWGDIPDLRNNSGDMAKWCGKHLIKHGSPISQILRGPFKTPIVLVANLPETQELLAKSNFDRSDYIINRFPLFGDFHLNMKTNNKRRVSRAWLKDLLSRQHLYTDTGPYIRRIMADLISVWEFKAKASKGMPFSISADLKNVALDVVMAFQFAEDFKDSAVRRQAAYLQRTDLSNLKLGQENQVVEFPSTPLHDFQHGLHILGDKMGSIYTTKWPPGVVSWWARYVSSYYRKYFVAKDNFIRDYIEKAVQRSKNNEEAQTGFDKMIYRELAAARKERRPTILGKQIMIDESYGSLIAGEHTTSAAMVWVLKFLSENPTVQEKLRNELKLQLSIATQESRLPTAEEFMNAELPYLNAVIEETLRLRAAMLVPRDAVCDTQLLGCMIPKGTVVLLVCQGPEMAVEPPSPFFQEQKKLRNMPGNPDLEVFDPERWLIKDKNGKISFDCTRNPQLAFGIGVRACWGRKLALLEMRMMAAMVTLRFDIMGVPPSLSGHGGIYDISFKPLQGYVRLQCR